MLGLLVGGIALVRSLVRSMTGRQASRSDRADQPGSSVTGFGPARPPVLDGGLASSADLDRADQPGSSVAGFGPARPPVLDGGLASSADARAALLAGIAVLLMLLGAGPAWAHATLEGTDPADGTLLSTAPSTVTLTFSEPVRVDDGGVRLLTAAGDELPGTVTTVDNRVVITPTADLGTGTVIVSWQVISADSHPISGGFTFAVGQRTAGTVAIPTAEQDTAVRIATAAAQALAYLGVLACCGLIAFDILVLRGVGNEHVRRRIRRLSGWSAGIGIAGAVLLMPLTELRQRFRSLDGLLDPSTWTAQLGQDTGLTLVLAGAGVLLCWEAAWAVNQRTGASDGVALAGCGVAVGAFTIVGHTRGYGPVALVMTADLLHLTVAACLDRRPVSG